MIYERIEGPLLITLLIFNILLGALFFKQIERIRLTLDTIHLRLEDILSE